MSYHFKNFKITGFTLAEVLVTLAVIGVLAAITIPTLLQNTQERELKTAFKKAYSDIAQATQKIILENGGTMIGICTTHDHNCLKDKYAVNLNVIKNCKTGQTIGNCWHKNDGSTKYLSGHIRSDWGETASLILNNSVMIKQNMLDSTCKNNNYSPKGACGYMTVDINGFKKPNIVGKDIFYIHIHDNGISPFGTPDDDTNSVSRSTSCSKGQAGLGCAALALQDIDY